MMPFKYKSIERVFAIIILGSFVALSSHAGAQSVQRIEVKIKDYTFMTTQALPLMPNAPTVIEIRNDDDVRHDFGSMLFERSTTEIESSGVTAYGRALQDCI